MKQRLHSLQLALLAVLAIFHLVSAGGGPYYYQNPYCYNCGGSAPVQAICPAANPIDCSAIGGEGYCCPSGQVCTWSNSQVACCPEGCDCSWGQSSYVPQSSWHRSNWAPASSQWQPHSSWRPHSTWRPQPSYHPQPCYECEPCHECQSHRHGYTTVYAPASTTVYPAYSTNPSAQANGVYCSTITQNGPNLPTTAQGDCGTILIVGPSSEAVHEMISWAKMVGMVVGLQVMGGMVLRFR